MKSTLKSLFVAWKLYRRNKKAYPKKSRVPLKRFYWDIYYAVHGKPHKDECKLFERHSKIVTASIQTPYTPPHAITMTIANCTGQDPLAIELGSPALRSVTIKMVKP